MYLRVVFSFLLLLLAASVKESGLQIHTLNVGQAMSQIIVFPSGFTMIIDCPEDEWQSDKLATLVNSKLNEILPGRREIDVGIATHLHLDHIGYAGKGGFWALIEKFGVRFKKFIDRNSGKWIDADGNGLCTEDEIRWYNVGTTSGTALEWLCYATNPSNLNIFPVRQTARMCSSDLIVPPDPGTSVTIVSVDAMGAVMVDGVTPVPGDHRSDNENDFSVGVIIKFGDFTYGTFGDLDGEYTQSEFGYSYNNIEKSVIHRVGELDVYNVNHHGSAHSSSQQFINAIKPRVSVVSCGYNNSFGHPDQGTLDRLLAAGDVWLTNRGNLKAKYGDAIITKSDVTITVSSTGKTYHVSGGNVDHKYDGKGATQPRCVL